jgi:two-component system LytT family response regulator
VSEGRVKGDRLQVLVADDEAVARKRLLRLLAAMDGVDVAGECADGQAVMDRVAVGDVDVVLLDIRMPRLGGLEAAAALDDNGTAFVLVTAHPDHAVEAFELGAADYLVKPVEAERLAKALARVRERLGATSERASLPRLAIPTRQGFVLLDPDRVSHAVLDGDLVTIVSEDGAYLSDASLGDLQERLPRGAFERVHRRAILNLEHVARLEPLDSGGFLAHTRSGHSVEVSRQAARQLRRRLRLTPHRA